MQLHFNVYAMSPTLLVTPQFIYLPVNHSRNINLLGDAIDQVELLGDAGSWEWLQKDKSTLRYTAPNEPGTYTLTFYYIDDPQVSRSIQVKVYESLKIEMAPPLDNIPLGSEKSFQAIGGTGDYFVIANCGFANIDPDTGLGQYFAPDNRCDEQLTVIDSSDQEATVSIKIGCLNYLRLDLDANCMISEREMSLAVNQFFKHEMSSQQLLQHIQVFSNLNR